MAEIFSLKPGKVKIVQLPQASAVVTLSISYPVFNISAALISEFKVDQQVNAQFQKTLQNSVYTYAFGDFMGDVIISGVAFPLSCTEESTSGLDQVLDYYSENRMSNRLDKIKINFANQVIEAFLIGCRISSMDSRNHIYSFQFVLKAPTIRTIGQQEGVLV